MVAPFTIAPESSAAVRIATDVVILTPLTPNSESIYLSVADMPLMIGRDHSADVHLTDRWVSRRHCEIDCVGNEIVIRDLESKHGTYVNDSPVIEKYLLPNDKVSIGLVTFQVSFA